MHLYNSQNALFMPYFSTAKPVIKNCFPTKHKKRPRIFNGSFFLRSLKILSHSNCVKFFFTITQQMIMATTQDKHKIDFGLFKKTNSN